jgi:hypothetical protein
VASMSTNERIFRFRLRVAELRESSYFKSDFQPSYTIHIVPIEKQGMSFNEPDPDDLRSFLLTFRQFLMTSEPIYLYRIYNVLEQAISDDDLRVRLRASRSLVKRSEKSIGTRFYMNREEVTPKDNYEAWISSLFHSDSGATIFMKLLPPNQRGMFRFQFLRFLDDVTKQILEVDQIIETAVKADTLRTA